MNIDIKKEYDISERKKAEIMALLTNNALYYDEKSNNTS